LSSRLPAVALGAAALALAGPAGASAATKTVDAGTPPSAAKQFEKLGADVNAFFPSTVTVNVGDTVKFNPVGFHNADFPKKGGTRQALLTPTGQKAAGVNDAAGAAFWFNGLDTVGFNKALLPPGLFGKTVTYTGAKAINSGLPLLPKPKPYKIRFTKAGTFNYFCDIHPGMKGTVRVLGKGRKVPTAKQDAERKKAQIAAALKTTKSLQSTKPATGTVSVGAAGPHGEEIFAFFPSKVTVPVGSTLRFEMAKASFEAHTATTGPGNPEKERDSYLGKLAATFESPVLDPIAVYPSDAPPAVPGLTPSSHGNGFWNSGVIDNDSASPVPSAASVRFDAAGTYDFYCLIHPFMKGTVTVQ
jgi:plastocyanin